MVTPFSKGVSANKDLVDDIFPLNLFTKWGEICLILPMEKTLLMLKPGVLQRRLVGEMIRNIENKGLKLVAMKMRQLDKSTVRKHYSEHVDKDWFPHVEAFTLKSPVILMVAEGPDAIRIMRKQAGATYIEDMEPGTIRGNYALGSTRPDNCIHASDSSESAQREIDLYFQEDEICSWEDPLAGWM